MTLEEAIKFNKETKRDLRVKDSFLSAKALQLGIEALEFFKDLRDRGALPPGARLPGETYIPQSVGKLPSDKDAE